MRTLPPVPCFPRASDCMVLLNSPSSGDRERGRRRGEGGRGEEGRRLRSAQKGGPFLNPPMRVTSLM